MNEKIILLEKRINSLLEENDSLKSQLKILSEQENKRKETLNKIKQIQNEYELSYMDSINDYKKRENDLKMQYNNFQNILEQQYKQNELLLINEINKLKEIILSKDNLIYDLQKEINDMNNLITQNNYDLKQNIKNKNDEILNKNKKIIELENLITKVTNDSKNEIIKLTNQLDIMYQRNNKDLEQQILFNSNNISPIKQNSNNNNSNENDIKDLKLKIILLENEIKILNKKILSKDNEINFWKNIREYLNNPIISHEINYNDYYNNAKINQLEKMIQNLGIKLIELHTSYKKSLINHKKELENIRLS